MSETNTNETVLDSLLQQLGKSSDYSQHLVYLNRQLQNTYPSDVMYPSHAKRSEMLSWVLDEQVRQHVLQTRLLQELRKEYESLMNTITSMKEEINKLTTITWKEGKTNWGDKPDGMKIQE